MNKPTAREYAAAILAGEQSRRSYGKRESNPHRHDGTERGRILRECWDSGWDSEDGNRRKR